MRTTRRDDERESLSRLRGPWLWRSVVLGMLGMFLVRLAYYGFHDVAEGHGNRFGNRLFEEVTGSLLAVPVVVGVVLLARRVPVGGARWPRLLAVHGAAFVALSTAHTTAMLIVRAALAPLVGLDGYEPRFLASRYAYEAANGVFPVLLLLGVLTAAEHLLAARDRERREAALERGLLEAELRTVRLQLQPHFLFNALNTIAATMYDDPRAADRQLGGLAELLRASLRTSHAQEVPAREELQLLDRYVALLQARFGARLAVRVDAAPDALDCRVPSMLLQPLLENAVRHGGVETSGHGRIAVTVARTRTGADGGSESMLEIRVLDDGPGLARDRDPFSSGTGLSATAQRLRLLYGDAHTLAAGDAPGGGFEVVVRLPARPAPDRGTPAVDPGSLPGPGAASRPTAGRP